MNPIARSKRAFRGCLSNVTYAAHMIQPPCYPKPKQTNKQAFFSFLNLKLAKQNIKILFSDRTGGFPHT